MKDFGQWFNDFAKSDSLPQQDKKEQLPEGVWQGLNGRFYAQCCVCLQNETLEVDVEELPSEGYKHYCGGSICISTT